MQGGICNHSGGEYGNSFHFATKGYASAQFGPGWPGTGITE
jgi:hypothetical protein